MRRSSRSNGKQVAPLALTVIALVMGCATTPTISYDQKLAALVGSPAQDLVRAWGPPTATLSLEGGRKQYVYEERRAPIEPPPAPGGGVAGAGFQSPERRPTLTVDRWCRTTFDVDANGTIVGSQYAGSGCGARR
jgi:hypothetical protein